MGGTVDQRAAKMRAFLFALTGDPDMWHLIGRTLYRRGTYGTFKLDVWSGGTHHAICGLAGMFTPHSGGPAERIEFRFEDMLSTANPTANRNFSPSLACCSSTNTWDWGVEKPESLRPLEEAISEWVMMWDLRDTDIAEMEREAERSSMHGRGARSPVKR